MTMYDVDWAYYATTEGCYILKDDMNNQIVCFHCDKEDPWKIKLTGRDLFVVWYQGDITAFFGFGTGIENIVFERNDDKRYRVYDYERFKQVIFRQQGY